MMKKVIKWNENVELHINITDEMLKDFRECERMSHASNFNDCMDCNECSVCGSLEPDEGLRETTSLCEIPEVIELLRKGGDSDGRSDVSETTNEEKGEKTT